MKRICARVEHNRPTVMRCTRPPLTTVVLTMKLVVVKRKLLHAKLRTRNCRTRIKNWSIQLRVKKPYSVKCLPLPLPLPLLLRLLHLVPLLERLQLVQRLKTIPISSLSNRFPRSLFWQSLPQPLPLAMLALVAMALLPPLRLQLRLPHRQAPLQWHRLRL